MDKLGTIRRQFNAATALVLSILYESNILEFITLALLNVETRPSNFADNYLFSILPFLTIIVCKSWEISMSSTHIQS